MMRTFIQRSIACNKLTEVDYTSLSGNPPAELSSENVLEGWEAFLPGFDLTHHQLSAYVVELNKDTASVRFVGKADHFLGNEVWTVEGSYDAGLNQIQNKWVLSKLAFHLVRQTGNMSVPAEALKNASPEK